MTPSTPGSRFLRGISVLGSIADQYRANFLIILSRCAYVIDCDSGFIVAKVKASLAVICFARFSSIKDAKLASKNFSFCNLKPSCQRYSKYSFTPCRSDFIKNLQSSDFLSMEVLKGAVS